MNLTPIHSEGHSYNSNNYIKGIPKVECSMLVKPSRTCSKQRTKSSVDVLFSCSCKTIKLGYGEVDIRLVYVGNVYMQNICIMLNMIYKRFFLLNVTK